MINKSFTLAAILSAVTAQQVHAADGTINFQGALTAQTCSVSVNGVPAPTAASVTLPPMSADILNSSGRRAGKTYFDIALSDCSGAATTAATFFEAGSNVDMQTGWLKQMDNAGAANVALELLDSSTDMAIRAGNSQQLSQNSRYAIPASGAVAIPYAVQYVATSGAASAGAVVGSVTYSINYQ